MSKKALITARIAILEDKLGKSGNILGKAADIGNGTVGGWTDNQIEKPTAVVEKFLRYYNIRAEWWKTGEGEVFSTSVQKHSDDKENSLGVDLGEAIRKVVEDNTEYLIIPKVVLEGKYRLVPIEQIQKDAKELEDRTAQIMGLHDLIKQITHDITARPINIQLTSAEKT